MIHIGDFAKRLERVRSKFEVNHAQYLWSVHILHPGRIRATLQPILYPLPLRNSKEIHNSGNS